MFQPRLMLFDEITSALDVSVQATIIELLRGLQAERGLALLFITHNLPLVRSIAQRVAVLHEGTITELGDVATVLAESSHPYTRQLIADTPSLETAATVVGLGEPPTDAAMR